MKTLKFTPELCDLIISGKKTATWRLFDDKDLQEGDDFQFVNSVTGKVFGNGSILKLKITTLGQLEEGDWLGHETFVSEAQMYDTYKSYYGSEVGPTSELKIVHFSFNGT